MPFHGEDSGRSSVRRPMGRAVRLLVVLVLAGCESEEPSGPVGVEAPCDGPALRFEPSGSYRVTIEERGQTYRSTLRFEPSDDGWSAVETELSVEPPSGSIGSLDGAELRWQLDESGVPLEPPRVRGEAHPGVLQNLTAFAFRPAGLTMDPVCQEIVLVRRWVDGMERTRRTSYQVASVNDERVTFSATSTITTAVNEWRSEGRVSVDRTDGFTGTAELEVTGPGTPREGYERRVVVERVE